MKKAATLILMVLVFALSAQCSPADADPAGSSNAFHFGALEHGYSHPSMQGVRPTTYTGSAYAVTGKRGEAFRLCVIHRESKGFYGVTSGKYVGAYQFGREWVRGLSYHVAQALRADGLPARWAHRLQQRLAKIPLQRWSRKMQDIAFFSTLNHDGPFSGWRHWDKRGSRCNSLIGAS